MSQFPPNACVDVKPAGPTMGTLVCLPGVNSGAYLFGGAVPEMGQRWRIIAINPPGVEGMPLHLPLTAHGYAQQALALLDALGTDGPLVVLGHSLGGFAAQELARLAPHRVSKLILVSTCRGQPDITRDIARMPFQAGMDFWSLQRLIEKNPGEGHKKLFGPGYALRESTQYLWFLQQRQAHLPSQAATLAHITAGGAFSSTSWAGQLNCPTLVMHGDADILVSHESGKALAQSIPGARFLSLYGVGHFPMLENPRFWGYVSAFAQGLQLGEEAPAKISFFQRLKERLWRAG